MTKKAVLIGCNYPGTQAELKGCVNDVRRMHDCLVERYGFSEQDISMLIDTDDSYTQPTGRNICAALSDLVSSSAAGDFLFVHYSGHGTRLPAETGDDDDTGYDECIVPTDMNLITDDDFRELVDKVPKGCRITIVSDSCHSGGLIDAAKEQIGESTTKKKQQSVDDESGFGIKNFLRKSVEGAIESRGIHILSELHLSHHHHHRRQHHQEAEEVHTKDKSLPLSVLMEMLKQKTGKNDIDAGKLRPALFDIFGEDATPKVKKLMEVILSKIEGRHDHIGGVLGLVGGLALQFLEQKLEKKNGTNSSVLSDSGILISGCQTDETSADATPSGDAGRAYGALSNAIQTIIAETGGKVSNRGLVIKARELLKKQGFTQHPGLYCSDDHVDDPFVCKLI